MTQITLDYIVHPKICPICQNLCNIFVDDTQCHRCWLESPKHQMLMNTRSSVAPPNKLASILFRTSSHFSHVFGDTYERLYQYYLEYGNGEDWADREATHICHRSSDVRIVFEWDKDHTTFEILRSEIVKTWYPQLLRRNDLLEMERYQKQIAKDLPISIRDYPPRDLVNTCCYFMNDFGYDDGVLKGYVRWCEFGGEVQEVPVDKTEFREYCAENSIELKWVGTCRVYDSFIENIIPTTDQSMMMFKLRFGIVPKNDRSPK